MVFDSPNLKFKSVQYANNTDKLHLGDEVIKLTATKDGSGYDVSEDQILIKVHSAALNPVDLILYNSAHPFLSYIFGKDYIYGIGRDYSGTVVSVGEKVEKKLEFKVGDKVCGMYSHAFGKGTIGDYIIIDPFTLDLAICLQPKTLDLNTAASWPLVFGTASIMISKKSTPGPLDGRSKILVIGASTSVGRYVIQLAKNVYGVNDIVGVCSPRSEPIVKKLGVSVTVDYTNKEKGIYYPIEDYVVNGGSKFDMIFDCCGNSDLFVKNRIENVLKTNGDYVTVSGDVKYDYGTINIAQSLCNNLKLGGRLIFNALGLLPYNFHFAKCMPGAWIDVGKESLENGKIKADVDGVYQLQDFDKAFERLKSNRAQGKIVIEVNKD